MIDSEPIYVYDSRSQFVRPLFVCYDFDNVDVLLKALNNDDGPNWSRPSWAYVTKIRMHVYERDTYKSNRNREPVRGPTTQREDYTKKLLLENSKLRTENKELKKLADEATWAVESWKASNMNALRDLAVEILTKKD